MVKELKEAILELKHLKVLAEHGTRTDHKSLLNKNLDKRVKALQTAISTCQKLIDIDSSGILPEEKTYDIFGNRKCVICGADDMLHQSETYRCPHHGLEEKNPEKKQRWDDTIFTQDLVSIGEKKGWNACREEVLFRVALTTVINKLLIKRARDESH